MLFRSVSQSRYSGLITCVGVGEGVIDAVGVTVKVTVGVIVVVNDGVGVSV